jgi:hypothetical protein
MSKQKISTNQADLKKNHDGVKIMMVGGPSIALGTPKLEGPRGKNPTSLYGQSTPGHKQH